MNTTQTALLEHTHEWRKSRARALTTGDSRPLGWRRETTAPLELRDADPGTGVRVLRSYASLFNTSYTIRSSSHKFEETVRPRAFKRTLSRGPDVVFRYDHTGPPLARTTSGSLRLGEDELGLWYEADLNTVDPDVQALIPKIERGDLSESSFAFRCVKDSWNDDYTERSLDECDINRGDVSVVTFGASRATGKHMLLRSEAALRRLHEVGFERVMAALVEWRDYTLLPPERRTGKVLSSQSMETLRQVLDLISDADEELDEKLGEAQSMLADLMGVPNPKTGEEGSGGDVTDAEQLEHVGRANRRPAEARAHDSGEDGDTARTTPHLLDTVLVDLGHARQHAERLFDEEVQKNSDSQMFNATHMLKHLDGAQEHAVKLDQHLSEYPSDPETHRSERERLTSMRNEETTGDGAETRDDPTYEDYDVMCALKQAKLALSCAEACQLSDPDYATDADDQAVMARIQDSISAINAAIVAQSKDGRRDDDDERAAAEAYWSAAERLAAEVGVTVARDAEGVTAKRETEDGAVAIRRTFTSKQREGMASKGQAMPDGSYPIANRSDLENAIQAVGRAKDPSAAKAHIKKRAQALGLSELIPDGWRGSDGLARQTLTALAENDCEDLSMILRLRSLR